MAKAKKVTLINKKGGRITLPKDEAERILAWCEKRSIHVGLWKLDESDKKENE